MRNEWILRESHSFRTPVPGRTGVLTFSGLCIDRYRLLLYESTDAGHLNDIRHVFPLVQRIQMNTVDTQCTILVDLSDGIFDTCFLEISFFYSAAASKGSFSKGFGKIQYLEIISHSLRGITQALRDSAVLMVAADPEQA